MKKNATPLNKNVKGLLVFTTLAFAVAAQAQNTIPTTHVTGSMNIDSTMIVRDSLHVMKDLQVSGDVHTIGEMVVSDNVTAGKDLLVDGNLQVNGRTQVLGDVFFNNGFNISQNFGVLYSPASGTRPNVISFMPTTGGILAATKPQFAKGCSTFNVGTINSFSELMQVYDASFSSQVVSMGISGGNGVISFENIGETSTTGHLKINPTCVNDVIMCEGGGVVGVFKNFEIGAPSRNMATSINMKLNGSITKAIAITSPSGSIFEVESNGRTHIGAGRPLSTGTAANAMLSVDGLILAKEVRIMIGNTYWADYVFSKNYKLMPLKEVEQFVAANNHLPEVPSASEVKENGVDIVNMEATLLKKIEELTLYIIAQDKKIDALQSQVEQLKTK